MNPDSTYAKPFLHCRSRSADCASEAWTAVRRATRPVSLSATATTDCQATGIPIVIGLEPVLAARPLVHDDAQAPSSTPVRSASLRGQLCSGVGTAHWARRVSKVEEISPGSMQRDAESTRSSHGFLEIPRPSEL